MNMIVETSLIQSQVSLLTAADFWRTKSIPTKGIPAIKTSDGPNGARGGIFVGGTKVSCSSFKPANITSLIIVGCAISLRDISSCYME